MTKKQIKILIITFIIVLLIVFLVFLLTNNGEEVNNNKSEDVIPADINSSNNSIKSESQIVEEPIVEKKKEDVVALKIKAVAKNFAERYGTWSTDNKENNFKSAEIYATTKMKGIIQDFIESNDKLAGEYLDFYGVTAKALNAKINSSDNTRASLSVSVQQTETSGENLVKKTSYNSLDLELIKYNEDWLVNYAEWEN